MEREQWTNQMDFIFSTVGFAVGLGNVWRFPYLAYENGGGSFLIPYSIMLFFAGLPLFFMELGLGQYTKQGPTRAFDHISPVFKGLGYAMLGCILYKATYYNVIMSWSIFYMFSGFSGSLPWNNCTVGINSANCGFDNNSVSPAEDYFNYVMLGLDDTISWTNFGTFKWKLALCLLAAWTIVCLVFVQGIKSSGKVVYFTAVFPYVMLVIFFINGLTLEGAADGIAYYMSPQFDRLLDLSVWRAAANQIFFSLGPSLGCLISMASHNRFNNNCHKDAVLVSLINCGTSVFAGFVVFSYLGYMAHLQGKPVEEVVTSGPALAFIAYPRAMSTLPVPQLWSFLFFFMLLTLGLDSMFAYVETIITVLLDHFKWLRAKKHWLAIGICSTGFLLGLSMVTSGGVYLLTLIDKNCASWNILLCAIIESLLVAWVYGTDKFMDNINEMGMKLSQPLQMYYRICWRFVTPGLLFSILVMQFVDMSPVKYGHYVFPPAVQAMGWVIACTSAAFIPGVAAWQLYQQYLKMRCPENSNSIPRLIIYTENEKS